jgi:hypothetical protein
MAEQPRFRVGTGVEDRCAACKTARRHTVTAVAGDVVRVICDYCGSQHQYRGGPREERAAAPVSRERREVPMEPLDRGPGPGPEDVRGPAHLERLLRRVVREELGLSPAPLATRFVGGELVLRPGRPGLQEKTLPIETFFHKVVMVRNRLRVLEQQINGAEIPEALKIRLQGYVTGCYGTLTSFNVLFEDEAERFHGTGGEGGD